LRGWLLLIYAGDTRVNLSSTPHPQPLSHAGERGARGENPIPLLPTVGEGVRG